MLSLLEIASRFCWIRVVALYRLFGLATQLSGMILAERDDEWLCRLIDVLGIIDGCTTILLPVLAKFVPHTGPIDATPAEIEIKCPWCGRRGGYSFGDLV